jgi:GT2 family glycosyltransferase
LVKGHLLINRCPGFFLKWCFAVGSFLIVERNYFERSGGFNMAFFLYFEETELCRRLQAIGGPPYIEDSVSVLHEGFGSHESPEQAFKYEPEGFLTYCRVTSQPRLIQSRLRQLWVLGFFSKTAKHRYAIFKKVVSNGGFK